MKVKCKIMSHRIDLLVSGVIVNQHLNVKEGILFSYTVASFILVLV